MEIIKNISDYEFDNLNKEVIKYLRFELDDFSCIESIKNKKYISRYNKRKHDFNIYCNSIPTNDAKKLNLN